MLIEKHEEEVVEQLLSFWGRYKTYVISMFLTMSFFIVAYSYTLQRHQQYQQAAAEHYQVVLDALDRDQGEDFSYSVQLLQSKFPKSPYAALATMSQAGYYLKKDQLDAAASAIEWLNAHNTIPVVHSFAKLKKAEIAYLKGDYEGSQNLLLTLSDSVSEPVFSCLIKHLQAKNYAQMGDAKTAFSLYKELLATPTAETDDAFKALLVAEYNYLALTDLS